MWRWRPATDLFDSPVDAERVARIQELRAREEDRAALVTRALRHVTVTLPGGAATVAIAGSESPRERIWLQFDAATDDTATALATWATLESLLSDRPNRHRVSVVGRAQVAVVLAPTPFIVEPRPTVPYVDGGALGAQVALLRALRAFGPSVVVHAQDWTGAAEALPGVRQIESYRMEPELHEALPRYGRGRRWSRARRAYKAVSETPDWQWGARVLAYARRLGVPASPALRGAARDRAVMVVHELAPGRYAPVRAVRRLGGGSLAELALAETGAQGITVQMAGGTTVERATHALALAEAAIVHRLNLAAGEGGR